MLYSFPSFEPVHCSMSGYNFCFLTCIQVSQETSQVVCYSISLRIFHSLVSHAVKGFSIVNEAEVDVLLEFPCFLHDPVNVGNLISGCSAFSKPYKSSLYICKFSVHILLKPSLKDFAAAAAVKSLQLYPTGCDPIDGSLPGSPIPGILQARVLE